MSLLRITLNGEVVLEGNFENAIHLDPPTTPEAPPEAPAPQPQPQPVTSGLPPDSGVFDFKQFGRGEVMVCVAGVGRNYAVVNMPPDYAGPLKFSFGGIPATHPTFTAELFDDSGNSYGKATIPNGEGTLSTPSIVPGRLYRVFIDPSVAGSCSKQINHAF